MRDRGKSPCFFKSANSYLDHDPLLYLDGFWIIRNILYKIFQIILKINLVVCPVVLWLEIEGEVGVALCCVICPLPGVP